MFGISSAAVVPSCAVIAIATGLYIEGPKGRPGAPLTGHIADHCDPGRCPDDSALNDLRLSKARAYFACAEKATRYVLNAAEALDCSTKYLDLKLSFLPDVSLENYGAMSPSERSETNRLSYLLYLQWKTLQFADDDTVTWAMH